MKILLLLGILVFNYSQCFTQSLEGEWKGSCIFDKSEEKLPYALFFVLQKDSSYKIFSYSKGIDNLGTEVTAVCEVTYKIIGVDSIYLEETKQIKPKQKLSNCFAKMTFKIIKSEKLISMSGPWESISKECKDFGTMVLTKTK